MRESKIQEIDPHFSESSYIVSRDLVKNHDPLVLKDKFSLMQN